MRQLLTTTCARIGRMFLAVSASLTRPQQNTALLLIPGGRSIAPPPRLPESPGLHPQPRAAARRNEFWVDMLGERLSGPTRKNVTLGTLQAIHSLEPSCLPAIREATRKRDRVYVTDNRAEMYPRRAVHLHDKYVEIVPGWYMATNLGAKEFHVILRAACEATGLAYGRDVRPSF